jgi:hypothetical protein
MTHTEDTASSRRSANYKHAHATATRQAPLTHPNPLHKPSVVHGRILPRRTVPAEFRPINIIRR